MSVENVDVAIVGGGAAGLAAAISAKESGAAKVVVFERGDETGGILTQCIHTGFGLVTFNEELAGPEYVQKLVENAKGKGVEIMLNATVLGLTREKLLTVYTSDGVKSVQAKSVIIGTGCRERTRHAIATPGTRPAGVFTAGTAQRLINVDGFKVGRKAVILGSGDVGLIMARRLTLEGVSVDAVIEILPYANGSHRNVVQCLEDFNIPLLLSHTVTGIHGNERVTGVNIAQVDAKMQPVLGTERFIECDTVLLSVGMIPDVDLLEMVGAEIDPVTRGPVVNELMQTTVPGVFAAGNGVHVQDLADYVSADGVVAGKNAAFCSLGKSEESAESEKKRVRVKPGKGIRYVVPHRVSLDSDAVLALRVTAPAKNVKIVVKSGGQNVFSLFQSNVRPGEMNRFKVSKEKLSQATGEIIVELEAMENEKP